MKHAIFVINLPLLWLNLEQDLASNSRLDVISKLAFALGLAKKNRSTFEIFWPLIFFVSKLPVSSVMALGYFG